MLDFLTFTGVDSETPMKELLSIAQSYGKSHVEFGVLVGSHTGESNHGIFPPFHVVRAVKSLRLDYGVQMAIHLCGRYSRMVMQDPWTGFLTRYMICAMASPGCRSISMAIALTPGVLPLLPRRSSGSLIRWGANGSSSSTGVIGSISRYSMRR